jgi:DNA polymerase-3 subunit epsilon
MELSDQLIDEVPLAVLDTETTGLEPALGHRIIELAILRLENWQEVGRFNQLINPGRTIPPSASRINHIFDVDVAKAPPFVDYADDIAELLQGARHCSINAPAPCKLLAGNSASGAIAWARSLAHSGCAPAGRTER